MGFGAKLNFAFLVIILAMALSQAGFSVVVDYMNSKSQAKKNVEPALAYVNNEITAIYRKNGEIGQAIESDYAFKQAFNSRDRPALAQAIKSTLDRFGFPGFVTIILDNGIVFYSSDTPGKSGYRTDEYNKPAVSSGLEGQITSSTCTPSITKSLALSTFVPIRSGSNISGVLAVSLPLEGPFLAGLQGKAKLSNPDSQDFDLALYSMRDAQIIGLTPGLGEQKNSPYLLKLNQEGAKAIRGDELEFMGRLWKPLPLFGPNNKDAMGLIYATAKVPDISPKLMAILGQVGIGAGVAIFLAFLFSAGLSRRFNTSMQFLKQRAKDLSANRPELPSLNGLTDDWMELGEMMDTAVSSPRNQVLNLRQQLSRINEEMGEKQRQVEAMNSQLENVNRQLSTHNRQAAEVNKQASGATMQAIIVQHKLASVLQVSTEGFLLLDPFGNVLSANPTFLNWMGVSEREIAGRHCFDLVKKPGESKDFRDVEPFSRPPGSPDDLINQFYPEGVVYHRYEDKSTEVLVHLQPVMLDDTNIEGYTMVIRNKSVHSELARLRDEIVDILTAAIRAPLAMAEPKWTSILGSQIQNADPALAKTLVDLHKTYQQLLGVVDSYLMMYGGFIPAEVVPREQVAITRLVGECLEQVAEQAREHQIVLDYKTVTGLPTTAINKELVRDIITQLIEKTIAITAPGGRVRAETLLKDKEIRLAISSSGPAVPEADIEDMFIGFIDGKHNEDSYQSRLSMYLARNNAERLGGRIWAESEAGRGTSLFLTLPIH